MSIQKNMSAYDEFQEKLKSKANQKRLLTPLGPGMRPSKEEREKFLK